MCPLSITVEPPLFVSVNCLPLQPRASELTRLPRKVKPVLSDKEKEKLQRVAAARKRQTMVSRVAPPTHLPGTRCTIQLFILTSSYFSSMGLAVWGN